MDFKTASDALFERVSHETDQIGVSVSAIRQARLDVRAKAHRQPPKNWERAIVELAENRIRRYHELIGAMSQAASGSSKAACR